MPAHTPDYPTMVASNSCDWVVVGLSPLHLFLLYPPSPSMPGDSSDEDVARHRAHGPGGVTGVAPNPLPPKPPPKPPSKPPPKPPSVPALGKKAREARDEKRASEKEKGGLFQEEEPAEPLQWAADASDRGRVCFVPREFWPQCARALSADVKGWRAVVSSIKSAKRGVCLTCIGEEGTRNANVFVSLAVARARGIIPLTF